MWDHISVCVSVLVLNSVVEILEKHGLQKPISYVKNSQSSEEEAHQLMVKLCRHTGRKYELAQTHTCMNADTYFEDVCLSSGVILALSSAVALFLTQ